jgi:hypothetical protein
LFEVLPIVKTKNVAVSCSHDLYVLDIEITNTGRCALWYKDTPEGIARNVVGPISLQTEPSVRIVDAYAVEGATDSRRDGGGMSVVRDRGQWAKGTVEMTWQCLARHESQTIRIVYVEEPAPTEVVMVAPLKENLVTNRRAVPEPRSLWHEQQDECIAVLLLCLLAFVYSRRLCRLHKLRELDARTIADGVMPAGLRVSVFRDYIRRYGWTDLALCTGTVLYVLVS